MDVNEHPDSYILAIYNIENAIDCEDIRGDIRGDIREKIYITFMDMYICTHT